MNRFVLAYVHLPLAKFVKTHTTPINVYMNFVEENTKNMRERS